MPLDYVCLGVQTDPILSFPSRATAPVSPGTAQNASFFLLPMLLHVLTIFAATSTSESLGAVSKREGLGTVFEAARRVGGTTQAGEDGARASYA